MQNIVQEKVSVILAVAGILSLLIAAQVGTAIDPGADQKNLAGPVANTADAKEVNVSGTVKPELAADIENSTSDVPDSNKTKQLDGTPGNVTDNSESEKSQNGTDATDEFQTTVATFVETTQADPTDAFVIPPLHTLEELESIPGPWACSSRIFCQGPLLDAVQRNKLFQDSKTFVDMPLKTDPDEVIKAFNQMLTEKVNLTKEDLTKFVEIHFAEIGNELEDWTPPDWTDSPAILEKIIDEDYRAWASELNQLWKTLGRRVKDEVFNQTERYSIIPVPNGFVVPGDRFREFYYWDTYWIINGLLLSGMVETTRGILENFFHVVEEYGFVPNGGRIYYTQRSQPPLLSSMVDVYYEASHDDEFIKKNFFLLDREYNFWIRDRTVSIEKNGKEYDLAVYKVNLTHPRPEGYMEDLDVVRGMYLNESATKFSNLASGAESGWDYSTRWFEWTGKDELKLKGIIASDIVPVDLNTFLYYNEKILAKFAKIAGHDNKVATYESRAEQRLAAMEAVLWHTEDGIWYDYHISEQTPRDRFYLSNIAPLLIYSENDTKVKQAVDYLKNENVLDFPGGLPTSLIESHQQWDFPNAWAPIVYLASTSLANSNVSEAKDLAFKISVTWLESAYKAWQASSNMYEKYTVTKAGSAGGGGEYKVQVGFGWTNGYVLQLLDRYSDVLEAPQPYVPPPWMHKADMSLLFILMPIAIFIAAVLMFICFMRKKNKKRAKGSRSKKSSFSSSHFQKIN